MDARVRRNNHRALRRMFAVVVQCAALIAPYMIGEASAAPIPPDAYRYRLQLTQTVQAYCGLGCPVADFAAQIHQESRWNANAKSPVGARGMTQFMPATSKWIAGVYPRDLGDNKPADPAWAMRAMVLYDRWLWARVKAADDCNRSAKAKSAYNGGLGWVYRDEKAAIAAGADSSKWFESVERFNAGRNPAAFRENRDYPRRILLTHAPLYARAGWGRGVCSPSLQLSPRGREGNGSPLPLVGEGWGRGT